MQYKHKRIDNEQNGVKKIDYESAHSVTRICIVSSNSAFRDGVRAPIDLANAHK